MSPPEIVTFARKTSKPYHTSHIVTLCHATVIHIPQAACHEPSSSTTPELFFVFQFTTSQLHSMFNMY